MPLISLVWALLQYRGAIAAPARQFLFTDLPGYRGEIVLLMMAGYIGTLGAPLLAVENVRRDYPLPRTRLFAPRRHHSALDGVSFDIRRGERVGLVGESGSGKSTLTRAILGLEPVQAGRITLEATPVGPAKMKAPTGRVRSLRPARARRTAFDTIVTASSWLTTDS